MVPSSLSDAKRTPVAEFRRWLIVACVFAVLGGCLTLILSKLNIGGFEGLDTVAALAFWSMFAFGESWVQFDQFGRRVAWSLVGCLTIALLMLVRDGGLEVILLCLIPAVLEFRISWPVRSRPWAWVIATPLIYGSVDVWTNWMESGVRWMTALVAKTSGSTVMINQDIASGATFFAVILIARAIVGSFIASRRSEADRW